MAGWRAGNRTGAASSRCESGREPAVGCPAGGIPREVNQPGMIVLHLGYHNGRLLLWAEADHPAPLDDQDGVPAYPFDAGRKALAKALAGAGLAVKLSVKSAAPMTAWLPTRSARPFPSTPLIAEAPRGRGKVRPQPWRVQAWAIEPSAALDFLAGCGDRHSLAPGVVAGAEVGWWAAAARFAGSLVTRQQYLPGVVLAEEARSVWEPVTLGADGEQLAALARSLPPVARALTGSGADEPPEIPARMVLMEFVGQLVDCLVRSVASSDRRRPATLHEEWLASLSRANSTVTGAATELAPLAKAIRDWRAPLSAAAASPFRLVVRLDEPDEEEHTWWLRFLLQPHEDPSLLVDLDQVWGGRPCAALDRYGRPGEYLLLALGQVRGLCPAFDAALADPCAGVPLATSGAFEFLDSSAPALEQAGFRVLLPAWWRRRGAARLTQRAKIRSAKHQGSGVTIESLVRFDWEVALGEHRVSLDELAELAALKEPLVRLRGQWVQLDPEALERTIAALRQRAGGEMTVREALELATTADGAATVTATGWMARLLKQFTGGAEPDPPPLPAGLRAELRPYQVRGYAWLSFMRRWGLGACLADDMGLGKTLQTLTLVLAAREAGERRPALLVCPTSVVNNWRREAERFTPEMPLLVHHGLTRRKADAFVAEAGEQALVVSSYGLLHRDLEFLQNVAWSAVILDEAQNVKNSETLQAKAARALTADCRIALTGTPVENHVGDLWSLMAFLNPGLMGSAAQFRQRYFLPIQIGRDPDAAASLRRLTGPFVLRRLKTDPKVIADLPEKQEMKVFCSLTKEQASLYAAVLNEAEAEVADAEGIERRGRVLAMLTKLKQVCNHPAHLLGDGSVLNGRSGKLARLTEMLEEVLAVDDRALVFTQYAEMGTLLVGHLQETFGREMAFLHGGVARARRDTLVERFQQSEDGPPVFVLSLKAGGTGLNLTRANHVFHFDRWWNPAVENQATDRAFRIGQTRNVQVHKMICAGTLEEAIDTLIDRKRAVAEDVVGTGESWLTELSNQDLHELVALRGEAREG